tara:strand:+ start:46719 stop:46976 length:258 start_codon:yes stop_codon:yes gene_type:complete
MKLQIPLIIISLAFPAIGLTNERMERKFGLVETHKEPHSAHYLRKKRNLPQGYPVTGPNGVDESDTWNKHSHKEPTAMERLRDKN